MSESKTISPKYKIGQLVEIKPPSNSAAPRFDRIKFIEGSAIWKKEMLMVRVETTIRYFVSHFERWVDEDEIERVVEDAAP